MIPLTKIIGDKSVVQSQLGVAHATITLLGILYIFLIVESCYMIILCQTSPFVAKASGIRNE
jgi:hypothetical protein